MYDNNVVSVIQNWIYFGHRDTKRTDYQEETLDRESKCQINNLEDSSSELI